MLHIVLDRPEIPQNTGNIARTCAATGAFLHHIEPLGFELSDRYLKRAGLDYWHLMRYDVWPDWERFRDAHPGARMHFATTKAPRSYAEARYLEDDYLVFGRETKGLDEELLAENYASCVRIPMRAEARSLNLSNSVAIVLFEALRQLGFPGLERAGALTGGEAKGDWRDYV